MSPFWKQSILQVFNSLIAVFRTFGCAAGYHLIIYMVMRQLFEYLSDCKDVCPLIDGSARQLFWCGKAIGTPLGVGKRVCITTAEVYQLDIAIDAGQHDVIGFQVEMEHLVAVQTAYGIQQLTKELLGIILTLKVIGVFG